jgi:Ca2+-transporting ATPase
MFNGFGALAGVALTYWLALRQLPVEDARALAFAALVVANVTLIFSSLSQRRSALHVFRSSNRIPLIVGGSALGALLLVFLLPGLREVFRFGGLSVTQLALALLAGVLCLGWYELVKFTLRTHAAGSVAKS